MRMRKLRSAAVIVAALICAGQVSEAQTVTLFGNAMPSTPVDSDTAAVPLGVKFWSSQPGTIAGIRFYRAYKASSSSYTVKLFSAGGTLLASANRGKDTCAVPCWEQMNFASPLSIAANTTYVAAYYTGNGQYADDHRIASRRMQCRRAKPDAPGPSTPGAPRNKLPHLRPCRVNRLHRCAPDADRANRDRIANNLVAQAAAGSTL
jgi:hypothetical protein